MSEDRQAHEQPISGSEGPVDRTTTLDADSLETILSVLSKCQQPAIKTPVFLAHSQDDETVSFVQGQGLYESIKNLGFDVTWREYEDGGHWIHSKYGVDDISTFLDKIINV